MLTLEDKVRPAKEPYNDKIFRPQNIVFFRMNTMSDVTLQEVDSEYCRLC